MSSLDGTIDQNYNSSIPHPSFCSTLILNSLNYMRNSLSYPPDSFPALALVLWYVSLSLSDRIHSGMEYQNRVSVLLFTILSHHFP